MELQPSKLCDTKSKNRHRRGWNRVKSSEITPHEYDPPIFDRAAKGVQRSQDSLSNKWCRNSWPSTCRLTNLDADLTPFAKIHSRWARDQNVKCKTRKLPEDHGRENPDDLGCGDAFLDTTPKTQLVKEVTFHWTSLKLKPSAL